MKHGARPKLTREQKYQRERKRIVRRLVAPTDAMKAERLAAHKERVKERMAPERERQEAKRQQRLLGSYLARGFFPATAREDAVRITPEGTLKVEWSNYGAEPGTEITVEQELEPVYGEVVSVFGDGSRGEPVPVANDLPDAGRDQPAP